MLENLCPCDHCSVCRFAILKGLRTNGHLQQLEEKHLNFLKEGLQHSASDVRLSAFALICPRKKGIAPSNDELILATKFIIDNLSVDDPAFRQVSMHFFLLVFLNCFKSIGNKIDFFKRA